MVVKGPQPGVKIGCGTFTEADDCILSFSYEGIMTSESPSKIQKAYDDEANLLWRSCLLSCRYVGLLVTTLLTMSAHMCTKVVTDVPWEDFKF